MKKALLLTLLALFAGAETADAQRRGDSGDRERMRERMAARQITPQPLIGVRGGYDFDTRDFSVGAQAQLPLGRVLRAVPSADVFLGEELSWQANADVAMSLLFLRAGGGLALVDGARAGDPDGNAQAGLNLFTGIQSPGLRRATLRPFAEARWTLLDDDTLFRLVAGVNVPMGAARR